MKKFIAMQHCPQCGSNNIKTVNKIHAVWRALPVYKCESCSLRFSVRVHEVSVNVDLE